MRRTGRGPTTRRQRPASDAHDGLSLQHELGVRVQRSPEMCRLSPRQRLTTENERFRLGAQPRCQQARLVLMLTPSFTTEGAPMLRPARRLGDNTLPSRSCLPGSTSDRPDHPRPCSHPYGRVRKARMQVGLTRRPRLLRPRCCRGHRWRAPALQGHRRPLRRRGSLPSTTESRSLRPR
jgi:hypothetical protein